MHVMNWDTTTHVFVMPFKCSWGIRVFTENMLPSFHAWPPVTDEYSVPVIHGGWSPGSQQLFKSLPGWMLSSHLPPSSQLSLRPAYPVDAGSTSSQTEPVQGVAGGFTSYLLNEAQALSPLPHSSCKPSALSLPKKSWQISAPHFLGSNGFMTFPFAVSV